MSAGTVYAIASGKGGVGKTTIAANLGAVIAEGGFETVVVDADVGMANLAEYLDLEAPAHTIHDVLADRVDITDAVGTVGDHLYVVPGTGRLSAFGEIDPDRLAAAVEPLRSEYDYVLLDVGAGLSYESAVPLWSADRIVLVADPTPAAIRDTSKTAELAKRIDATVAGVIINRSTEDDSLLPSTVASRIGSDHLGTVPHCQALKKATTLGTPITEHAPDAPSAHALRRIAYELTGRESLEPTPSPEPGTTEEEPERRRGLLARLLGR